MSHQGFVIDFNKLYLTYSLEFYSTLLSPIYYYITINTI